MLKSKRTKETFFYLVSVAEFTNLSGDQVSLVLLHVDGVYVILQTKNGPIRTKKRRNEVDVKRE